jgi:hypothetical protein
MKTIETLLLNVKESKGMVFVSREATPPVFISTLKADWLCAWKAMVTTALEDAYMDMESRPVLVSCDRDEPPLEDFEVDVKGVTLQ